MPELTFQRTDNLTDHRPYIPGDDPRRINWKLYGHGGGLIVREGEREPPPHSNILILVDTEFDPLLYSVPAARRGIDLLCENALAAAIACGESGMDVLVGYTSRPLCDDGKNEAVHGGKAKELASALALPAAILNTAFSGNAPPARLPAAPDDRGILIMALPRSETGASALDRYLKKIENSNAGRKNACKTDLVFFCGDFTGDENSAGSGKWNSFAGSPVYGKRLAAAAACAALYSRRPGVTARAIGV